MVSLAQTAFGVDLMHALCERAPEQNVLVSPTSAAQALSLLYPDAGGETAEAPRNLLHLPEWSPAVVAAVHDHTAALDGPRYAGDLDDEDAPDSLQTSNRLWTAHGVEPDPQYLNDIPTALEADVRALDFANDRRRHQADQHHRRRGPRGIIEELFDDALPPRTVAVLTNAVHLKARWADAFDDTEERVGATEQLPDWLAQALVKVVGLTGADVARLSVDEAHRRWTEHISAPR
jgi:serpin B